ncbi:hypothetical protein J2S13_002432 [Oikeobacillus pervagus]|uniref:Uncharacterized protein n=1 Tax=Oikeobacillus pervagus TaxID=1325931 RepID=A0AAJ1T010_9BACI|nr:hypothetical protein [Oikeobacillus pervagus]MDQ0216010.1 hypothetical protein [Oikeobacillus pervagus]
MDEQKRDRLKGILDEEMKPVQTQLATVEKEIKELKEQQSELISLIKELVKK